MMRRMPPSPTAPAWERLRTARPRAQLRAGRTDWYRITNLRAGTAQVHIYDEIGYWGITAADLIGELSALDVAEIELHISSPGGEIFDGIAIYNALRSHTARVTTHVDSLAASIASVIAMAGDRVVMAPHSQMMIHDGSGLCIGNAADMREGAEQLDRQSDNIAAVYAERAGGTAAQWRKRMIAETWFTAKEAVEAGLADEVGDPGRQSEDEPAMAARWDLSIFRYPSREAAPAPAALLNQVDAPEHEPESAAGEASADLGPGWDPTLFTSALADATDEMAGYDPDILRSAIRDRAENAPAPPRTAPARTPEPDHYDPAVLTRALKEAIR